MPGPRSAAPCRSSAGSSCRSARGPTAKPNASTAPCSPTGPTPARGPATPSGPRPLAPSSTATTLDGHTPHSQDDRRSADSPPDRRQQRLRSGHLVRRDRRGQRPLVDFVGRSAQREADRAAVHAGTGRGSGVRWCARKPERQDGTAGASSRGADPSGFHAEPPNSGGRGAFAFTGLHYLSVRWGPLRVRCRKLSRAPFVWRTTYQPVQHRKGLPRVRFIPRR